jgi:hypothetical protein
MRPIALARLAVSLTALAASSLAASLSPVRSALFFENSWPPFGPGAGNEVGSALAVGDFDCDGRDDLAVGAPLDDPDGVTDAGSVQIRYGLEGIGVDPGFAPLFLSQLAGLAPDAAEVGDQLGAALAGGDFNGDGCDDLAIGVPGENGGGAAQSGAVQIHYGGPAGLDDNSPALFDAGFISSRHAGDRLGSALAAGDFNGDGRDDLAIGVPWGEFGSAVADCGYVLVLPGSGGGVSTSAWQFVVQGNHPAFAIRGTPEVDDRFGAALAVGRFDDDAFADLAIGVPGESVPEEGGGAPTAGAGMVSVVYGSATGLSAVGDQIFDQDSGTLADQAEAGDAFGSALAVGDFNAFGPDDLAIGVPFESVGAAVAAGVVQILLAQDFGLATANAFYWTQDGTQVGVSESSDLWGWSLAAGDFDADGRSDLAVGSWNENTAGAAGEGAVIVLDGPPGPFAVGQLWHQNIAGVPDAAEGGDWFGRILAAGDFDGNGHADLAVAAPRETGAHFQQGAVAVFYGSLFSDGFETADPCRWSSTEPGAPSC